ncbi:hypothetical protein LOC51_08695 [Rubrivivax sp. JA1024]|nr:hypothetical protein [Rubrivivax sp. JA1024]
MPDLRSADARKIVKPHDEGRHERIHPAHYSSDAPVFVSKTPTISNRRAVLLARSLRASCGARRSFSEAKLKEVAHPTRFERVTFAFGELMAAKFINPSNASPLISTGNER